MSDGIVEGEGYAVGHIDQMGDEYGFRKIRRSLGVTAFGINAIRTAAGIRDRPPLSPRAGGALLPAPGEIEIEFDDGEPHRLEPGGAARVSPATVRRVRNVGEGDAVYVVIGGKDGYVGRDGQAPEGETGRAGPSAPPGA